MLGILLIDKPLGITSHDVVNDIRRRFGTRRVGHAGTLDPLATGLLIVAVGPATRFLQYLPLEPKEYVAEATFGKETTTQDAEGTIVRDLPIPDDLATRLAEVLPQFRGLIQQTPPMFSAVKKAGKPLYEYARKGEDIERSARTIHIEQIDLENVAAPVARMRIICSGGTYVRTLVHDIGQALGCGAHLSFLNRERVGKFHLRDAISLNEATPDSLVPLKEALPPVALLSLSDDEVVSVREGRALPMAYPIPGPVAGLIGPNGQIVGVGRIKGNLLQPECVIPSETNYDSL